MLLMTLGLFGGTVIGQETLYKQMTHGGQNRQYIVYIPASYDGSQAVPLMLNFHGYTQIAGSYMGETGMTAVADTAGFILVFPQGSLFFGNTHWKVGSWTNGSTADDLGFTAAMIDALAAEYSIDLSRVYSCGFSNGGYFSFELACQLSPRIAAIGAVGGTMSVETYQNCSPQHPTPVLTIHGTSDPVVSYYGGVPAGSKSLDQVHTYWNAYNQTETVPEVEGLPDLNPNDGYIVEYYTYTDGLNCTTLDHYKLIGAGHKWPGPWQNGDINASSAIWNFVSQYDINGLIGCGITSIPTSDLAEAGLLLYPNPARETLMLELESATEELCRIYDLQGRMHLTHAVSPGKNRINVSALPANVYFVRVGEQVSRFLKS